MSTAAGSLFGRARETQLLSDLLDGVPVSGGALVVRGDSGIGKSAILAAAAGDAAARGMAILRTAGVPSEAHLPFAGLHQLLQPLADQIEGLPAVDKRCNQAESRNRRATG